MSEASDAAGKELRRELGKIIELIEGSNEQSPTNMGIMMLLRMAIEQYDRTTKDEA